jgi:hypothetical protein
LLYVVVLEFPPSESLQTHMCSSKSQCHKLTTPSVSKQKLRSRKSVGLRLFFALLARNSHEVLSNELGLSIVKLKTFGTNFTRSPPFWADGTEAHKTALMCVDAVKSKYQLLNKCKLLFNLVVHQQQLHCLWQHSSSFGKV